MKERQIRWRFCDEPNRKPFRIGKLGRRLTQTTCHRCNDPIVAGEMYIVGSMGVPFCIGCAQIVGPAHGGARQ